jgi:hypothetical protein
MYLVLFLNQQGNYEFNVSLHSSLPKAEAAYEALMLRFGVNRRSGETRVSSECIPLSLRRCLRFHLSPSQC